MASFLRIPPPVALDDVALHVELLRIVSTHVDRLAVSRSRNGGARRGHAARGLAGVSKLALYFHVTMAS
jgi:hypothetical protein